jgi:hypothetical protein
MTLIIALLAPMFLGVGEGDVRLARMAATETVNAYRARNQADLLAVAQIVAFGLAALGSLSLSLADDISLPMMLRLRGNANACNRSAEQNRRALAKSQADDPGPHPAGTAPGSQAPGPFTRRNAWEDDPREDGARDIFLSPAAAQMLAGEAESRLRDPEQKISQLPVPPPAGNEPAENEPLGNEPVENEPAETPLTIPATPPGISEQRHQAMWAIAMVAASGEVAARIPSLPLEERDAAAIKAATLSSTGHALLEHRRAERIVQSTDITR